MTSLEQLANFNDSIGKSISKDGYTLTLDNVAADDNFVHVFYTVTSENEPFYNNSDNNAPIWSNSLNVSADIQCVIKRQAYKLKQQQSRKRIFCRPTYI